MKPVYICEDFKIENKVLIIDKPILVGMVHGVNGFNMLINTLKYNAIICPELAGDDFDYVLFR